MGCSASRPNTLHTKKFCLETTTNSNIASSNSPKPFSLQAPLVHHPPSRKGDTHHLVSLTSTTYGSLLLINDQDCPDHSPPPPPNTINKITPMPSITTSNPVESLSPDSVINTWELMDGLDDDNDDDHDFKFDKADACGSVKHSPSFTKPLWKHLSEESLLSKMDPNVASSYRRALSSRQLGFNHQPKSPVISSFTIQIVIYFTSLRGIRKTYEDCCSVRMILKSYRVAVDERDVSMDSTYRKELQGLLGVEGKPVALPQVFIREKHIGGAEEIKQLNENGELGKLLQGFPVIKNGVYVCESCGDARFVPCPNCCGSRKVFDEVEDQLRRCPRCNENGLIRCPACYYSG